MLDSSTVGAVLVEHHGAFSYDTITGELVLSLPPVGPPMVPDPADPLPRLVTLRQAIQAALALLAGSDGRGGLKREITTDLDLALITTGRDQATWGGWRVHYAKGARRTTLDPERLLKAGVSADVLKACTVTTTGPPSLRVTRAKKEDA